jgi:uncharacterized DUF497 family protein
MNSDFEWDPGKAASNLRKHGVSFTEAATIFFEPLSLTVPDPIHSLGEIRFVTVGRSFMGRFLVVVHSDHNDKIRIISARRATSAERKAYESGVEQ